MIIYLMNNPENISAETVIDFIRHGEPEGGRMYRGNQVDHPLSETGWQQMHNAIISKQSMGTGPKNEFSWDLIVSSPMQRCIQFARVLSKQLAIPLLENDALTEISFGDWEGKTPAQIEALDPVLFHQFYQDPVNNRPANAESLEAFGTRIIDAISTLLKEHPGKKILLVTHAGIMRTILVHVLSAPLIKRQSIRFPYAGMLRLYSTQEQWRLEFL